MRARPRQQTRSKLMRRSTAEPRCHVAPTLRRCLWRPGTAAQETTGVNTHCPLLRCRLRAPSREMAAADHPYLRRLLCLQQRQASPHILSDAQQSSAQSEKHASLTEKDRGPRGRGGTEREGAVGRVLAACLFHFFLRPPRVRCEMENTDSLLSFLPTPGLSVRCARPTPNHLFGTPRPQRFTVYSCSSTYLYWIGHGPYSMINYVARKWRAKENKIKINKRKKPKKRKNYRQITNVWSLHLGLSQSFFHRAGGRADVKVGPRLTDRRRVFCII